MREMKVLLLLNIRRKLKKKKAWEEKMEEKSTIN